MRIYEIEYPKRKNEPVRYIYRHNRVLHIIPIFMLVDLVHVEKGEKESHLSHVHMGVLFTLVGHMLVSIDNRDLYLAA